jgi:hypothetical protein
MKGAEAETETKLKPKTVPLDQVRWQLAKLWFGVAGPILLILIAQSAFGKYQGKVQSVWGWALPTIMPTLSLILAALASNALEPEESKAEVRRPFYRTACWLSAAYLILVLATVLIEPFTKYEATELMALSNLWLGPFQGLVASAIGVLFFTKQPMREP